MHALRRQHRSPDLCGFSCHPGAMGVFGATWDLKIHDSRIVQAYVWRCAVCGPRRWQLGWSSAAAGFCCAAAGARSALQKGIMCRFMLMLCITEVAMMADGCGAGPAGTGAARGGPAPGKRKAKNQTGVLWSH